MPGTRGLHLLFVAIALLLTAAISVPASATELTLTGRWSYQYSGSSVVMTVDRITSLASSGTSGSLRLELWAFGSPFKGSRQLGYRLATHQLDPLSAGASYSDVSSGSVAAELPPTGRWYMALILGEWNGDSWPTKYYLLSDADQLMVCSSSSCEVITRNPDSATVNISSSRSAYTVDSDDTLALSAEISAGNDAGALADAYITASLDLGAAFYLDSSMQWVSSIAAAASNFPLASVSVPNFFAVPIAGLGVGNYQFALLLAPAGQNPAVAANQLAYNAFTATFKAANADGSAIAFTPGVNPLAQEGSYYEFDFYPFVAGGLAPYHFSLDSLGGFPPMGLVLAPNGILSGTPLIQTPATPFVVCAIDLGANQSCKTVSVTVTAPDETDPDDPGSGSGSGSGSDPDTVELSLTVDSATCTVGERFSFGTIVYNVINASGTASGPVGSSLNNVQCAEWTDCERGAGEDPSTTWTYQTTTYVGTPQYFSVTLSGNGESIFETETLQCPIQ